MDVVREIISSDSDNSKLSHRWLNIYDQVILSYMHMYMRKAMICHLVTAAKHPFMEHNWENFGALLESILYITR